MIPTIVQIAMLLPLIDSPRPDPPIHRDRQLIYDMFRLRLEHVSKTEGAWVVGEIKLGPESNFWDRENGTFRVVSVLRGKAAEETVKYDWPSLVLAGTHGPQFTAFNFGGTVFCNWRPELEGRERFPAVYLIPPGWVDDLKPALEAVAAKAEAFKSPKTATDELKALVGHKNPWIAVAAWRAMSGENLIGMPMIADAMRNGSFYRQAIFTFILLFDTPQERLGPISDILVEHLKAAKSAEELQGVAAAAFHALRVMHTPRKAACRWILETVEKRHAVIVGNTDADRYVADVIRRTH